MDDDDAEDWVDQKGREGVLKSKYVDAKKKRQKKKKGGGEDCSKTRKKRRKKSKVQPRKIFLFESFLWGFLFRLESRDVSSGDQVDGPVDGEEESVSVRHAHAPAERKKRADREENGQ